MKIKILGPGCSRCTTLERITRDAIAEMGITAEIEKEEDIIKIMNFGILHTPGLVINEKLILSGRIPSTDEMKEIITKNQ